jgi:hypothetical protein
LNARYENRVLAALLAMAILLGGMPIVASAAPHDTHPTFSLDICQPIQAMDSLSAGCCLPTLVACSFVQMLNEFGMAPVIVPSIVLSADEGPDPPPPKAAAL